MQLTVYGIKNCNTMKKAFDWLNANGIAYAFHDYKKSGVAPDTLARWCARVGHAELINTRGTTWRKLEPSAREISDEAGAITLMAEHTSLIRRPVVETPGGDLLIGFDTEAWSKHLGNGAAR